MEVYMFHNQSEFLPYTKIFQFLNSLFSEEHDAKTFID